MGAPFFSRHSLKRVVEDHDTVAGRFFDLFIQSLIILSLISFSIETLPELDSSTIRILRQFEILSVAVFTVEYLLRTAVADHKLKFIFSFYGLVDLVAILPFYLSTGVDLRSIRVFRLLRLFRIVKLLRYSSAIRRFRLAFISIKEELIVFIAATAFLLYASSVGIYYFEHEAQPETFTSIFHCLWWSVATLTTVGYGDAYPITVGGKIFTFIMLMVSLGIIAVPTGLIASALTKVIADEDRTSSPQEAAGDNADTDQ